MREGVIVIANQAFVSFVDTLFAGKVADLALAGSRNEEFVLLADREAVFGEEIVASFATAAS